MLTSAAPGTSPGVNSTIAASISQQTAGGSFNANAMNAATVGVSFQGATWVLIGLLGVWFLWSLVIHHTRMREDLAPANVATNIHNWFVVGLTAATFLVVMKIAWTKLASYNLPGADWVASFFAAT